MTHPLVRPNGSWMRDVLSDEEVARRVVDGELELFELLVRRYNQRLFRTARSVVGNDEDAEDALQLTYLRAWRNLGSFEARARFSTWLTRIALRTAVELRDRRTRHRDVEASVGAEAARDDEETTLPDSHAEAGELRRRLEAAIDRLPEALRTVFVLRVLEELPTAAVAELLSVSAELVKVRLFRARRHLEDDLLARADAAGGLQCAWSFAGDRCDRIVRNVLARLRSERR